MNAFLRSTTGPAILVIENDNAIREQLQLQFENAGYRTLMTPDALVAGNRLLADAKDIALIIVDADLPYMSGLEFASTIIADSTLPPLPIILLSAHGDALDQAAVLDVPCLVKPFTVAELIKRVDEILYRRPKGSASSGHGNLRACDSDGVCA